MDSWDVKFKSISLFDFWQLSLSIKVTGIVRIEVNNNTDTYFFVSKILCIFDFFLLFFNQNFSFIIETRLNTIVRVIEQWVINSFQIEPKSTLNCSFVTSACWSTVVVAVNLKWSNIPLHCERERERERERESTRIKIKKMKTGNENRKTRSGSDVCETTCRNRYISF